MVYNGRLGIQGEQHEGVYVWGCSLRTDCCLIDHESQRSSAVSESTLRKHELASLALAPLQCQNLLYASMS